MRKYKKRSIILSVVLTLVIVSFVKNDITRINDVKENKVEIQINESTIEELNNQVDELTFVLNRRQEEAEILKENTVKLEKLLAKRRIRYIPMDSALLTSRTLNKYEAKTKWEKEE